MVISGLSYPGGQDEQAGPPPTLGRWGRTGAGEVGMDGSWRGGEGQFSGTH